jgi:hypothetical protein
MAFEVGPANGFVRFSGIGRAAVAKVVAGVGRQRPKFTGPNFSLSFLHCTPAPLSEFSPETPACLDNLKDYQ